MNQRHNKLFQSIAEGIKNRNRGRKVMTRECHRVLDEIIKPAILLAQKNIEPHSESAMEMEFHPEVDQPYIRVDQDELHFICRAGAIEIRTIIDTMSDNSSPIPIEDISEDLVVDKIARFFKRVYDLQ